MPGGLVTTFIRMRRLLLSGKIKVHLVLCAEQSSAYEKSIFLDTNLTSNRDWFLNKSLIAMLTGSLCLPLGG